MVKSPGVDNATVLRETASEFYQQPITLVPIRSINGFVPGYITSTGSW